VTSDDSILVLTTGSALYAVGVEPPSMRKVVPVMKSVSGLARKQTAAAISRASSFGAQARDRGALAREKPVTENARIRPAR
jgi:hypothetical protein